MRQSPIYTLDGASWTPAGIASNPYLNELVVRNVLNKLTKEGASQEKIETTLEQYSVASAWLASNSIDTQAAIIAGATNLSATAIVAIITKNRGGKALTHSEISAIQRIAQNKKTTVNTNKDTVKNIPNLTKEGTLKNLAPNLSVTLNTSVRTLIKDSEGRYWLVNNSGARITPSGNYAYVTMPDGTIRVARDNNIVSTHTGLANGKDVKYAGTIRFENNDSSKRGQIRSWDNSSGHYKPPKSLSQQAGLPMDKFKP